MQLSLTKNTEITEKVDSRDMFVELCLKAQLLFVADDDTGRRL